MFLITAWNTQCQELNKKKKKGPTKEEVGKITGVIKNVDDLNRFRDEQAKNKIG